MAYLPPVVATLTVDDAAGLASLAEFKASLAELAAEGDASTASISHSLQSVGDSAVLGAAATKNAMEDTAGAVGKAEDDVATKSSSFSERVGKVFTSVGASMGNWGIPFGHSVSEMGSKIEEAETKGNGFKQSIMSIGKAATVVGGVALVAFAASAAHVADEFDVAQTRLQTAVKTTGVSFDSVKPQIDRAYASMENLGFKNEEVAKTLTTLTVATQSPTKAIEDLGVASNLSRLKGIGLAEAGTTLAKVYAGSNRALTQMGINLNIGSAKLHSVQTASEGVKKAQEALKHTQDEVNEGTLKGSKASYALQQAHEKLSSAERKLKQDQEAVSVVMAALEKRTKGQAAAFAGTLAGAADIAGAHVNHLARISGEVLMPALQAAAGVVLEFVIALTKGEPAAIAIAAAIGGPLVAAVLAYVGAMVIANAATLGIGLVIGAVAVGIYELITHFGEVTNFIQTHAVLIALALAPITAGFSLLTLAGYELVSNWDSIWSSIKSIVSSAVDFIEGIWHGLEAVTSAVWDAIKTVILTVWNTIKSIVTGKVEEVKSVVTSAWSAIQAVTSAVWGTIRAVVQTAWDVIRSVTTSALGGIKSVMSGAWSAIQGALSAAWGAIKSTVGSAWSAIQTVVTAGTSAVVGAVTALPGRALSALAGLVSGFARIGAEAIHALVSAIEAGVGSAASAVSGLVSSIAGDVPVVGGLLKKLASGGIVTSPTLAVIGEAGPEAVIPLSQLGGTGIVTGSNVTPLPSFGGASAAPATSSGPNINATIYTNATTSEDTINQLYLRLRPLLIGV